MKKYMTPEMEALELDVLDVIQASGEEGGGLVNGGEGNGNDIEGDFELFGTGKWNDSLGL